jgi:hypothetical protein
MLIGPPDSSVTTAWLMFFTPLLTGGVLAANILIAKRQERKADEVATIAVKTSDASAKQQKEILLQTDKIHTLVNSQYGIALALIYEKAKRIAELSKDPADKAEVDRAKQKLDEHEAKQHVVDMKET